MLHYKNPPNLLLHGLKRVGEIRGDKRPKAEVPKAKVPKGQRSNVTIFFMKNIVKYWLNEAS
jgi:hypothetical protein